MNKPGNNRVNAFTLFELMIALTITSIVIIVTILAYSIINKQFINYQKQSESVNRIYQAINTLENDLDRTVILKSSSDSLILWNYDQKLVYYSDESALWRVLNTNSDTLIRDKEQIRVSPFILSPDLKSLKIRFEYKTDTLSFRKQVMHFLER